MKSKLNDKEIEEKVLKAKEDPTYAKMLNLQLMEIKIVRHTIFRHLGFTPIKDAEKTWKTYTDKDKEEFVDIQFQDTNMYEEILFLVQQMKQNKLNVKKTFKNYIKINKNDTQN